MTDWSRLDTEMMAWKEEAAAPQPLARGDRVAWSLRTRYGRAMHGISQLHRVADGKLTLCAHPIPAPDRLLPLVPGLPMQCAPCDVCERIHAGASAFYDMEESA